MNIKDLIEFLQKCPPELDVLVLADEFACYYPLEKEMLKTKNLCLGHTEQDVKKIKRCEYPGSPKWREKDWFHGKCDIKKKRKVLTIS